LYFFVNFVDFLSNLYQLGFIRYACRFVLLRIFKVEHMEKSISSLIASPWQRDAAETLDQAVHGQLAKASMGTSPISMTLAYADWALHLAASPGRQMLLAQEAAALTCPNWQPSRCWRRSPLCDGALCRLK
jgi:Poly-beta-hydroxybutyrate polymerase N terminal